MSQTITYSPQRAFPRWPAQVDIRYGDEEQISSGEGFDISEGGLGFRGRALYPLGSPVELAFRIGHPRAHWIRVKAVVRYARPDRIGVAFVALTPQLRRQIAKEVAACTTHDA